MRRIVADFLLHQCGMRHLHGTKTIKLIRTFLDDIELQHVKDSYPCQSFTAREQMYDYMQEHLIRGDAIDYLEFGVFEGETIRYWVNLNKNMNSRFFGFDSFQGLPEEWRPTDPKGKFDTGGQLPRIDDARVKFLKGWFDETIPSFVREFSVKNRLVVHIDADLYSSTMLALVYLGPFLSKGDLIMFDEFCDHNHEFQALQDWQRIYKKEYRITAKTTYYVQVCTELV